MKSLWLRFHCSLFACEIISLDIFGIDIVYATEMTNIPFSGLHFCQLTSFRLRGATLFPFSPFRISLVLSDPHFLLHEINFLTFSRYFQPPQLST
ncbi:hypothetical protein RIF29_19876 [Crotalaria pallida]|uniref:Secreted protein n=1 Tax=Crotalaria pallida TaxID=3830 RepID=A0AAN9F3D8_CROPI